MAARQWSKSADPNTLGNTLAGLHAPYIMFLLDESGGLPDAIMASAEAALSSCTEGHIVQAGNPTNLEGPLYRACTTERPLWNVVEINGDPDDPKRSPRVSVQWAREQIVKFGKDNPWVRVNVFGQFPPASFNALLGPEDIRISINRKYREPDFQAHPIILGVDVARFGDDSCVIFPRQGLMAHPPRQYRNIDGTQGAEIVTRIWNEMEADACFIDNTGGFGASWIDNLIRLGKDPIGVHFSEKPASERYFNRRSQMAFECAEWIKRGGQIPDIPELSQALTATTYTFKDDKLIIEPKDDIKEKLHFSPDHMDALWLTFALPIERKARELGFGRSFHQVEYNPFSRDRVLGQA
jgi:phage terminase large subunit